MELLRSSVKAQRTVALETLRHVLRKAWTGKYNDAKVFAERDREGASFSSFCLGSQRHIILWVT